jgi:hypothetical protein
MLREVMEIASGLPFSSGAAAALPSDRSIASSKEVLYHAFIYLRYVVSEAAPREDRLLPALRCILGDPHRRVEREDVELDLERASFLSSQGLARLVQGDRDLVAAGGAATAMPLAQALCDHLPRTIPEPVARTSIDTPTLARRRWLSSRATARA